MKKIAMFAFGAAAALLGATTEAAWTWDSSAQTLTDGTWTFAKVTKVTLDGVQGLSLGGTVTGSADILDFTSAQTDCGYPVIKIATSFSAVAVRQLIAPDLLSIHGTFAGNTTIEEITVSPNLSDIGGSGDSRYFNGCTSLRSFTPTVLPRVTGLGKYLFQNCSSLTGDFAFAGVTAISQTYVFYNTRITSLSMPNLVSMQAYFCQGNTAITNFYAPKCTTLGGNAFSGCSALKKVVVSGGLTSLPGSVFSGCSSLEDFSPLEFPNITTTTIGANIFRNCSRLRGTLSIPNAVSSTDSSFQGCGFDEIYAPSMNLFTKNAFIDSPNLAKVTVSTLCNSSGGVGSTLIKNVNANGGYKFDLYWSGTTIPTSLSSTWFRPNTSSGGVVDSDARIWVKPDAWQAWTNQWSAVITLAANFPASYKASAYYPGDADTLGAISYNNGYAWFCNWTEKVRATIACPSGVEIAQVVQGLATIPAEDGKYPLIPDLTVDITYRTLGTKLFSDGTREYTVSGVTAAETIPASVCDKAVVDAEARIGEAYYLTVQAAFAVGGEVVLLKDVAPSAALAVPAGSTVTFNLNGHDLAAGGTVFNVAGTLSVVGAGFVGGSAFAGAGVYKLKGGTYAFDVSGYCASGFLATAQGTVPETWTVAQNTDVAQVTLDLALIEAAHVGTVDLVFDGDVPCVTNGTVVSWTMPKNAGFSLVYSVATANDVNYRFADRSRTATVAYPSGIAAATEVTNPPAAVQHAKWHLNVVGASEAYLEDGTGTWKLRVRCANSSAAGTLTSNAGRTFTGYTLLASCRVSGSGALDLLTCSDDTGSGVIEIASSGFQNDAVTTSILAPDVVAIRNSAFRGATAIASIEVSPDFFRIEQRVFQEATGLRTFTPSNLPDLEDYDLANGEPGPFSGCVNLTGDFVFGKVTAVRSSCFLNAGITSFEAPLATEVRGTAFKGCSSLVKVVLPNARRFDSEALSGCSAVKHIEFDAEHTTSIGQSAFSGLSSVTNFPTSFGALTYLGLQALNNCGIRGDLSIPKVPILDRTFHSCVRMTSVFAPACTNYGNYAFYNCTALTNVTVMGSRACFTGNLPYSDKQKLNSFSGCTALKTVYWLSEEPPANLMTACFSDYLNAGPDYEPPILYVGGNFEAWAARCTTSKANFDDLHRKVANYDSLVQRRIIGFIGYPSGDSKGITQIMPSTAGILWVCKMPPKGFLLSIQ